jgi:hypothetical protein
MQRQRQDMHRESSADARWILIPAHLRSEVDQARGAVETMQRRLKTAVQELPAFLAYEPYLLDHIEYNRYAIRTRLPEFRAEAAYNREAARTLSASIERCEQAMAEASMLEREATALSQTIDTVVEALAAVSPSP